MWASGGEKSKRRQRELDSKVINKVQELKQCNISIRINKQIKQNREARNRPMLIYSASIFTGTEVIQ